MNFNFQKLSCTFQTFQLIGLRKGCHHNSSELHVILTSVACAIGQSVNPLQNNETQHVNVVLQCIYQIFKQPNMKGNHA
jgi:hypothetical protein